MKNIDYLRELKLYANNVELLIEDIDTLTEMCDDIKIMDLHYKMEISVGMKSFNMDQEQTSFILNKLIEEKNKELEFYLESIKRMLV